MTTQQLRRRGFDLSYYDRSARVHRVRCSQCEPLVIQKQPCHERGCPNQENK